MLSNKCRNIRNQGRVQEEYMPCGDWNLFRTDVSVFAVFHRDLERDVVSETSGHFKRLLVSMLQVSDTFSDCMLMCIDWLECDVQANRDESHTADQRKAAAEAQVWSAIKINMIM